MHRTRTDTTRSHSTQTKKVVYNEIKNPMVSIVAISFNHEKYIRQALDSFIAQQTNFSYEIVIGDDCSTDETVNIIKEYSEKYPNLIKPILRQKNIGLQKNFIQTLRAAKGKYIALCECDDYWTDDRKLQLQIEFLEKNPDYALCFHPVRVFFEDNNEKEYVYPETDGRAGFTVSKLLNKNYIQTNSVVYRAQKYDTIPDNILPIDLYLHLFHAQFGKIGFINKTMSAYRRHIGGVWWDSDKDMHTIWKKHGVQQFSLYVELLKLYNKHTKHRETIENSLASSFQMLIETEKKYKTKILNEAVREFPDEVTGFIIRYYEKLKAQEQDSHVLNEKIEQLQKELYDKSTELETIQSSRMWKLRNLLARFMGKPVI